MTAPTLTEFLLACIAEDEAEVAEWPHDGEWGLHPDGGMWVDPLGRPKYAPKSRVLAECEAKRRIVARAEWVLANPTKVSCDNFCNAKANLFDLAAIYSDHADYQWGGVVEITQESVDRALGMLGEEWKP